MSRVCAEPDLLLLLPASEGDTEREEVSCCVGCVALRFVCEGYLQQNARLDCFSDWICCGGGGFGSEQ